MKIEKEMYARTKTGLIGKVMNINGEDVTIEAKGQWTDTLSTDEIANAQLEKINIVEIGDYVNEYKVIDIKKHDGGVVIYTDLEEYDSSSDIITILTKEQFKIREYTFED